MNDQERIDMVREAKHAQRAGVVLTLRDWKKMSIPERGAWITALELVRLDGDGAPAPPPPPEVRSELVASAARVAARKG